MGFSKSQNKSQNKNHAIFSSSISAYKEISMRWTSVNRNGIACKRTFSMILEEHDRSLKNKCAENQMTFIEKNQIFVRFASEKYESIFEDVFQRKQPVYKSTKINMYTVTPINRYTHTCIF